MSVASEARTLELLKIDYTNRLNTEYQLIPRKHMITLLQRFKHLPYETVERQSSRSVSNGRILTHPLRHHIRHSVELFCCEVEM